MTKDKALRLALEALEADDLDMVDDGSGNMVFRKEQAITAIKEALKLALDFIIATNKSSGFWLVPAEHMTKEALKLALEALENHCGNYKLDDAGCERWNKAVAAIKEALAQDELCSSQEPWMYRIWNDKDAQWRLTDDCSWPAEPIYTAPPAAQPEQGPSITKTGCGVLTLHSGFDDLPDGTKFYTTPPHPMPEYTSSIPKPNCNITFHRAGQEVGKFDFNGPELVFTGDAEESAKVFVAWVARYFHGRLKEEREAGKEEARKEMQGRAHRAEALAQPEHHALQAQGKHPAPCARHCEAQAFQIVIRSLEAKLKEKNT